MSGTGFQLAQINIAHAKYDREDPRFQPFIDLLDPVNAMAERMPGFVRRYQDEEDQMTVPGLDDPRLLINMSVWQDLDTLFNFAFKTAHAKVMMRRKEWFSELDRAHLAMWWVPEGHVPTLAEAQARLASIDANGPSAQAFNFAALYGADGQRVEPDLPERDCA